MSNCEGPDDGAGLGDGRSGVARRRVAFARWNRRGVATHLLDGDDGRARACQSHTRHDDGNHGEHAEDHGESCVRAFLACGAKSSGAIKDLSRRRMW